MRKYFILFLLLIIAISLYACGQKEVSNLPKATDSTPASTATKQTEALPVQVESEQKKNIVIEVTPPKGWEAVEGSVLPVQYLKNTASFMVKEEMFKSDTLDAVVEEALTMYEKSFSNLTIQGESETRTIDGKEAITLTFTCTISKMNMKYLYAYLFVEGHTYVITFGDLADSFDSLSADYETILENITFKAQ